MLRHVGELAFDDDAIADCRCAHLHVLDDPEDLSRGLLNFNMFSSPAYRAPHARSVMAWSLGDRARCDAIAAELPGYLERMRAWFRDPTRTPSCTTTPSSPSPSPTPAAARTGPAGA